MAGSSRTWESDFELSLALAHRIVVARLPAYASLEPIELGRGWDNLCVVYPDGMVFRLPTRKAGAALVDSEIRVLPALSARLPLLVPKVEYCGDPGADYPYPFFAYRKLPGTTADRLVWTDVQRSENAVVLAEFLSVLHTLPISASPFSELPDDRLFRKDPATQVERIESRLAQLSGVSLPVDSARLKMWARSRADHSRPSERVVVVHGDLYPRHLLAVGSKITAVIDWGDVHLGHPAIDLSLAYTFVPMTHRAKFFADYRLAISEDDLRLAQLRAAMYGTALLAYGEDVSDEAAAYMGRQILVGLPLDD